MKTFRVILPYRLREVTMDAAVTQMRFPIDSKMSRSWEWNATRQLMCKHNRSARHPRVNIGTKLWIAEPWRFSEGVSIEIEYLNKQNNASWQDAANNPWQSAVSMKFGDHRVEYRTVNVRMAKSVYDVTEEDAVACGYRASVTSSAAMVMQQDWVERHGVKACHRPHWVFDVQKVI